MHNDYSLLDANCARASEGLRVLSDIARFTFRDAVLAGSLAAVRHQLADFGVAVGGSALLAARAGGETVPSEPSGLARTNLLGIIRANASRASEALRALEEFAPLYAPVWTQKIASARYALYQHETELAQKTPHYWLDYYNTAGFIYPISSEPDELISYIENGARVVQLRDKISTKNRVFEKAQALATYAGQFNRAHSNEKVLVIINDHVDIAARLPVAGFHLGQTDGLVAHARRILGSNKIIGRSNNTLEELKESVGAGADYVSFGPVYPTPNKPERLPTGLKKLSEAVILAKQPLVAIGGVNQGNMVDLYAVGARNMAVISAASEFFG